MLFRRESSGERNSESKGSFVINPIRVPTHQPEVPMGLPPPPISQEASICNDSATMLDRKQAMQAKMQKMKRVIEDYKEYKSEHSSVAQSLNSSRAFPPPSSSEGGRFSRGNSSSKHGLVSTPELPNTECMFPCGSQEPSFSV